MYYRHRTKEKVQRYAEVFLNQTHLINLPINFPESRVVNIAAPQSHMQGKKNCSDTFGFMFKLFQNFSTSSCKIYESTFQKRVATITCIWGRKALPQYPPGSTIWNLWIEVCIQGLPWLPYRFHEKPLFVSIPSPKAWTVHQDYRYPARDLLQPWTAIHTRLSGYRSNAWSTSIHREFAAGVHILAEMGWTPHQARPLWVKIRRNNHHFP